MKQETDDKIFYGVMGLFLGLVIALTPFYLYDLTKGQMYYKCRLSHDVQYCVEAINFER